MSLTSEHTEQLQKLADKHAKYLKLAFLAAVVQLRNSVDNEELDAAITAGNIDAIFRLIDPSQLDNLLYGIGMDKKNLIFNDEGMKLYHLAAIAAFLQLAPDLQTKWNYNPINERVISALLADSSKIASDIVAATNDALMLNLTQTVANSVDLRARARDVKQLLGLTSAQTQAVMNYRSQLETQKVLGLTNPLNRNIPDSDKILIANHMKNGGLTQVRIDKMVANYAEQLLNQRAEQIALATAMNAINGGMQGMWSQGQSQGIFDANDRKFWVTAGDSKVRPTHRVIPGMNPTGVAIDSMFITPTGPVPYPMWGMGDYFNCRCLVILGRI